MDDKAAPGSPDYDVSIVGGGMVGASLAVALGPTGLRIAVIEAVALGDAGQPSYDDRSVALAYGSRRIFEGMGVWPGIEARSATPIHQIHISERGKFGFARLDRKDTGVEALGYVIKNRVIGEALLGVMQGFKNISVICPATMKAIKVGADAATVSIEMQGEKQEFRSKLVVIADGGRSDAREKLGIAVRRVDYGQIAVVANVSIKNVHHNVAFERFTPNGPVALLPMADKCYSLVWSVNPQEADALLSLSDDEFLKRLHNHFGDRLSSFVKVGKRDAYPLSLIQVDEHVRSRVALIGNAAHALHPVAGQGFNLGLRDVAVLAQVLCDGHDAGQDMGGRLLLEHYARWRKRDNFVVTSFTNGLVRVFSNDFFPLTVVRNVGLIAVDLFPPLKRSLVHRTMGLAGKLPRLARGLSLQ
ncbi:MAG TPA: 2-octaprenyl-6-methoxyphenyl hydroxylase [Acidiferrobacteraceae bacterium]|nr:2-octaprenyl-6-methoxyphenyl hydroxylase [Acidiferrobacteraceae bacterium]